MTDDNAPTIRKLLGGLPSEELLRLADELGELAEHPGFVKLQELVDVHRESVERRAARQLLDGSAPVASMDALIERESLRAVTVGTLRGLEQFRGIIASVNKVAAEVREALGVSD